MFLRFGEPRTYLSAAVSQRLSLFTGPTRCALWRPNFALGKVCRTNRGSHPHPVKGEKKPPRGTVSNWRWARDSNPGNLSVQRFSRPPLSTTQPAHLNCFAYAQAKRRIIAMQPQRSSFSGLIFNVYLILLYSSGTSRIICCSWSEIWLV